MHAGLSPGCKWPSTPSITYEKLQKQNKLCSKLQGVIDSNKATLQLIKYFITKTAGEQIGDSRTDVRKTNKNQRQLEAIDVQELLGSLVYYQASR